MVDTQSQKLSPVWRTSGATRFVISSSYMRRTNRSPVWQPPTDVYQTETAVVVQVEIAGMHDSEFTLSLESRFLVISGLRPGATEQRAYHRMEIPSGEFISAVEMPVAVDYEKAEALYQDGFLKIVLPKAVPSHIEVRDKP